MNWGNQPKSSFHTSLKIYKSKKIHSFRIGCSAKHTFLMVIVFGMMYFLFSCYTQISTRQDRASPENNKLKTCSISCTLFLIISLYFHFNFPFSLFIIYDLNNHVSCAWQQNGMNQFPIWLLFLNALHKFDNCYL